jgi:hypothetical protein
MHKGFKCLDISEGRVYISRDVIFDETVFPFSELHANTGARLLGEILLLPGHLTNPHNATIGDDFTTDHSIGRSPPDSQCAGENSGENSSENDAQFGADQGLQALISCSSQARSTRTIACHLRYNLRRLYPMLIRRWDPLRLQRPQQPLQSHHLVLRQQPQPRLARAEPGGTTWLRASLRGRSCSDRGGAPGTVGACAGGIFCGWIFCTAAAAPTAPCNASPTWHTQDKSVHKRYNSLW